MLWLWILSSIFLFAPEWQTSDPVMRIWIPNFCSSDPDNRFFFKLYTFFCPLVPSIYQGSKSTATNFCALILVVVPSKQFSAITRQDFEFHSRKLG